MAHYLFLAVTVIVLGTKPAASVIVWDEKSLPPDQTILIQQKYLKDKYTKTNDSLADYEALVKPLKKYSIDEKCDSGMDFGVGFQVYTPYVNAGMDFDGNSILSGIIPHITRDAMRFCCPKSNFTFGHLFNSILDIEEHFESDTEIDLSFPVYGLNGKHSTEFKDFPFIPVVTAPRIVLLVPDQLFQDLNTRTQVLMKTIFNAWPMLIFIIVSAMLAGLTVWLLDKKKNAQEFPPTFFSGAWEGIWWAFVTMTTVGYGDRSPKSLYARAFCIMWILMGIILISLFTGLVTAALSASATPVFNIPGAKIGAVRGSIEYQVGVGMNAEMTAYVNHHKLLAVLLNKRKVLHAAMIDNFILTASADVLKKNKLRLVREISHPVTYGIVMGLNSTKTEKCFRKYVRHYPQKIFEIIADKLIPVKNPTDEVRLEVAAAEELFYEETVFKTVVYTETGLLVCALLLGVLWEIFVRNKDSAAYRMVGKLRGKPSFNDSNFDMVEDTTQTNANHVQSSSSKIESLVKEYDEFHSKWIQRVRHVNKRNGSTSDKVFV